MNGQVPRPGRNLMRPGAVGGAVLRAARLSAGVSEAVLASAAGVTEPAVRGWEDGSRPLASERYSRVEQLERALGVVESDARLVADLAPTAWCDLVLGALMSDGEGDLASLLADPLAGGDALGELFAWAVDGRVPVRFRPFAVEGPLIVFPRTALTAAVIKLVDVVRRSGEGPGKADGPGT